MIDIGDEKERLEERKERREGKEDDRRERLVERE